MRKDLQEGCGFLDTMEVWRDIKPASEDVLLPPGHSVLVDLGGGYSLDESRVCSIICRHSLSAHSRGHRLQGAGLGKCDSKCFRKEQNGR